MSTDLIDLAETATGNTGFELSAEEKLAIVEMRLQKVAKREDGVERVEMLIGIKVQEVLKREDAVGRRENAVEMKEEEVGKREEGMELREKGIEGREQGVEAIKIMFEEREKDLELCEKGIERRERGIELREMGLGRRGEVLEKTEGEGEMPGTMRPYIAAQVDEKWQKETEEQKMDLTIAEEQAMYNELQELQMEAIGIARHGGRTEWACNNNYGEDYVPQKLKPKHTVGLDAGEKSRLVAWRKWTDPNA